MHKISLFALVLLIVSAIDSIRNLPASAIFGPSLLFFYLFSAIVFLFPISMIAAEFASRFPEEGGVFHWVKKAFGKKWAFVAVWLQWINTVVWYPTFLSFVAGTVAYLFDPKLAQNKGFLLSVILIAFWSLTLVNLKGIRVSVKLNSLCSIAGLLIPMAVLVLLGFFWIIFGQPTHVTFTWDTVFPSFSHSDNWISLIAIMASYVGMELAGVHVTDIQNPQKNFPKAIGLSVIILLITMILGSLAIAVVIPQQDIHLVDGIMQTFTLFFKAFHISWLAPVLALLIIVGSVGGVTNWIISPAKGLFHATEEGFFFPYFAHKNKHHVPARFLILQAVIVSVICTILILSPTINDFYWFFTALSTELYMMMYVLLFMAAMKLGRPSEPFAYHIPKGCRKLSCAIGLVGSFLTIVVGFFPPTGIAVGGLWQYSAYIALGNIILVVPAIVHAMRK